MLDKRSFCQICYDLDGRNRGSEKTSQTDILVFNCTFQALVQQQAQGCAGCLLLLDGILQYRESWREIPESELDISIWKYEGTLFNVSINRIEKTLIRNRSDMVLHLEFFVLGGKQ